jgi:hypothetical protein
MHRPLLPLGRPVPLAGWHDRTDPPSHLLGPGRSGGPVFTPTDSRPTQITDLAALHDTTTPAERDVLEQACRHSFSLPAGTSKRHRSAVVHGEGDPRTNTRVLLISDNSGEVTIASDGTITRLSILKAVNANGCDFVSRGADSI